MRAITTESRVRWTHTGIDAPHGFTVTGYADVQTGRGVAYSAELVHPGLGVVGRIANEGSGGPTYFHSYDPARFGDRELLEFLRWCSQDEEPMQDGSLGLEILLDEIITESETADVAAEMRGKGEFLVRSCWARDVKRPSSRRDTPLSVASIALSRGARQHLAEELTGIPAHRLGDGAHWQMFNGLEWTPLLRESPFSPAQAAARVRRAEQLSRTAPHPHARLDAVLFADGLHLFGTPDTAFTLIGDTTSTLHTDSWCTCVQRTPTIRFERWSNTGCEGTGVVHAAQRCRRLVRID